MKTQADKSSNFDRAETSRGVLAPLLIGIAVILFSTAGIARVLGWVPNSANDSGSILTLDETAPVTTGAALARPKCPDCGVIVSMREIASHDKDVGPGAAGAVMADDPDETQVKSTRSYEIIVRIADGSTRVIDQANPARWRTGERMIVIAGTDPSKP